MTLALNSIRTGREGECGKKVVRVWKDIGYNGVMIWAIIWISGYWGIREGCTVILEDAYNCVS